MERDPPEQRILDKPYPSLGNYEVTPSIDFMPPTHTGKSFIPIETIFLQPVLNPQQFLQHREDLHEQDIQALRHSVDGLRYNLQTILVDTCPPITTLETFLTNVLNAAQKSHEISKAYRWENNGLWHLTRDFRGEPRVALSKAQTFSRLAEGLDALSLIPNQIYRYGMTKTFVDRHYFHKQDAYGPPKIPGPYFLDALEYLMHYLDIKCKNRFEGIARWVANIDIAVTRYGRWGSLIARLCYHSTMMGVGPTTEYTSSGEVSGYSYDYTRQDFEELIETVNTQHREHNRHEASWFKVFTCPRKEIMIEDIPQPPEDSRPYSVDDDDLEADVFERRTNATLGRGRSQSSLPAERRGRDPTPREMADLQPRTRYPSVKRANSRNPRTPSAPSRPIYAARDPLPIPKDKKPLSTRETYRLHLEEQQRIYAARESARLDQVEEQQRMYAARESARLDQEERMLRASRDGPCGVGPSGIEVFFKPTPSLAEMFTPAHKASGKNTDIEYRGELLSVSDTTIAPPNTIRGKHREEIPRQYQAEYRQQYEERDPEYEGNYPEESRSRYDDQDPRGFRGYHDYRHRPDFEDY
jgi:hypothetical protein